MARQAKTIVKEPVWYVPDIEDNRADPDPFRVQISPMSGAELNELEATQGKFTKGDINFIKRGQTLVERIFSNRVLKVEGYAIAGKTPTNGKELYQAIMGHGDESERSIVDDIVEAIKSASKLDEGLLGNLKSQSVSPPEEVQNSGGAASDAAGKTETASLMTQPDATRATVTPNPIPVSDLSAHQG